MSDGISILSYDESAGFDPDRLEALCADVGEVRAEAEVAQALDRIGRLLEKIDGHAPKITRSDLAGVLRQLIAASDLIGMSTLARVSRDVAQCLDGRDPVALSATLSRLRRIGERSILAVWDLDNLSV